MFNPLIASLLSARDDEDDSSSSPRSRLEGPRRLLDLNCTTSWWRREEYPGSDMSGKAFLVRGRGKRDLEDLLLLCFMSE